MSSVIAAAVVFIPVATVTADVETELALAVVAFILLGVTDFNNVSEVVTILDIAVPFVGTPAAVPLVKVYVAPSASHFVPVHA